MYAFAIIAQEICLRGTPFCNTNYSPSLAQKLYDSSICTRFYYVIKVAVPKKRAHILLTTLQIISSEIRIG